MRLIRDRRAKNRLRHINTRSNSPPAAAQYTSPGMKRSDAIKLIDERLCGLDNAYGRPVFDEWAVVSTDGRLVFHYCGQREDSFSIDLADNLVSLRTEIQKDSRVPQTGGEFGFTVDGHGAAFDAYVCLGQGTYLICNNSRKSMPQITADPNWLKAQGIFLNLAAAFASNPLD